MASPLRRVLPAVVTPFDANEQFVPVAMEALLGRLYAKGAHGIYVLGQTGEGLLTPLDMRKEVTEFAVKASPGNRTVIIHIGAARTADALELARHASKSGAHAVSSLPPLGTYSFAEIRRYYEMLAAASSLPLLVYFFLEFSPAISTDQMFELCSIPGASARHRGFWLLASSTPDFCGPEGSTFSRRSPRKSVDRYE